MSTFYDQMIDLQNVRPNAVAILKVSYNATFDKFHLLLGGGLTKADIGRIEGKANGTTFFVMPASHPAIKDNYNGVYVNPNQITLDFTEPNTRGGAPAQYLASIPRNLLNSLTFEIEILSTAPVNMTLKCEAEYRDPTPNPFIMRVKDFNIPLTMTGDNDMMLPSGADGGLIKRIWLYHGGNVKNVELRLNGIPKLRSSVASMESVQKRNRLVPQANVICLDFLTDGNLMNMLNTASVQEAFLRLTTTAPDSCKAYIEYVADLRTIK